MSEPKKILDEDYYYHQGLKRGLEDGRDEVLLRVKETLKRLSHKPWKLIGTKWVYTQEDVEREFEKAGLIKKEAKA